MNEILKCTSQDEIMRFNWHILNWCNYRCSYCFVDGLSSNFKDTSQIAQEYKLTLARLATVNEPFEVCLTGGEPTLHPNIEEILEGLSNISNLKRVWFFTNLSRDLAFYNKINNFSKVTFYASYHPEYADVDRFLEKCIGLGCEIHISMHPNHTKVTRHLVDLLTLHNLPYKFNLLDGVEYPQEFIDHFNNDIQEAEDMIDLQVTYTDGITERTTDLQVLLNNKNRFKGYRCRPNSWQINLDNKIRNVCTSELTGIVLSDIAKQVKCPKEICNGGLMMYPKELV